MIKNKVLFIDDEILILEVIQELLEAQGLVKYTLGDRFTDYSYAVAPNVDLALKINSILIPQIIFLDFNVGNSTGEQIYAQLLSDNPTAKIIFQTSLDASEVAHLKPFAHLLKPYRLSQVTDFISST